MWKVPAVYGLVILICLGCSVIISMCGLNFWTGNLYYVMIFALFFAVFVGFNRLNNIRGRELFKKYSISKDIHHSEIIKMVLLGGVLVTSFLLVQAASVNFFELFGYTQSGLTFEVNTWWKYLVCVVTMAVLPAIFEELIFRGYILQNLRKFGPVAAVIISAALFSLYHMSPAQTVYQFVLGAACALVVFTSGKLVPAMILHFVNNFIIITYTFLSGGGEQAFSWTASVIVSAVVLAVLGSLIALQLVRSLKSAKSGVTPEKKFALTSENKGDFVTAVVLYSVCVVMAGAVWIAALVA